MRRRISDELLEEMYDALFQGPPLYDRVTDEQLQEAEKLFTPREGPYGKRKGRRYSVESRKRDAWNEALEEREHKPVTDGDIQEAYESMFA